MKNKINDKKWPFMKAANKKKIFDTFLPNFKNERFFSP